MFCTGWICCSCLCAFILKMNWATKNCFTSSIDALLPYIFNSASETWTTNQPDKWNVDIQKDDQNITYWALQPESINYNYYGHIMKRTDTMKRLIVAGKMERRKPRKGRIPTFFYKVGRSNEISYWNRFSRVRFVWPMMEVLGRR